MENEKKIYCDKHDVFCERMDANKASLNDLWKVIAKRVPIWVFSLACGGCIIAFGAMSGWVGYVQGQGANERREIRMKFESRLDSLIILFNNMRVDVEKIKTYLEKRITK